MAGMTSFSPRPMVVTNAYVLIFLCCPAFPVQSPVCRGSLARRELVDSILLLKLQLCPMLDDQGGTAHLTPRPAVCSPSLPRDHSLGGTLHSRVSDHHLKFPFIRYERGKTEE